MESFGDILEPGEGKIPQRPTQVDFALCCARNALEWCAVQLGQEKIIDLAIREIDVALKTTKVLG